MNDKRFMYLIVGIVVAFVGAVIIFGGDSASTGFIGDPLVLQTGEAKTETNDAGETVEVPVQPADRYKGSADSPVTLIEYADFECPACFGFYPELKQVEAQYGDQITVIFRHNPLSQLHLNAVAAHRASEAAANQGKFWEMHDLLYENQLSWSRQQAGLDTSQAAQVFITYAEQLGLDLDQYNADVKSQEVFSYIDSHLDSGIQLGVTGTPTLFLNGEEVPYRTAAELSSAIDEILGQTNSDDQPAETGEQIN